MKSQLLQLDGYFRHAALAFGCTRAGLPQGASIDGTITNGHPQSNGNSPMLRLKADVRRVLGE